MTNFGKTIITEQLINDVKQYLAAGHTYDETVEKFSISNGTVSNICHGRVTPMDERIQPGKNKVHKRPEVESEYAQNAASITVRSLNVKTLDQALKIGAVDLTAWEVDRYIINSWEVTAKDETKRPRTYTNWQVKVWLKRKQPLVQSLDMLLAEIQKHGPYIAPRFKPAKPGKPERELEISLFDPHLGLHCFTPGSDHPWDIETCSTMVMDMVFDLIQSASKYGPFQRIILPIGNDLFHADNVWHSTTGGTPQPEMESWQHVFLSAEELCIKEVLLCLKYAPVKVITVMGNHDRQSSFTMGRLLNAYFHNDKDVIVDCSASPYKFHHFGVNLIGFEHGHSIKQTVRLAALMANECRDLWSVTKFREWHLGDQHRKGSARTSMMEEQGVSVEYLPGLTPPNEWSRLKSFNWQKRAGTAFVWDKLAGPIARLQVHIDSYTGNIMKGT